MPIFLIAVLGFVCDLKPDSFIKIYVDIVQTVCVCVFKAILQLLKIVASFLCQFAKCVYQCLSLTAKGRSCCVEAGCSCDKTPAPEKPKKRTPKSPARDEASCERSKFEREECENQQHEPESGLEQSQQEGVSGQMQSEYWLSEERRSRQSSSKSATRKGSLFPLKTRKPGVRTSSFKRPHRKGSWEWWK
jgi:hypothetical protein